MSADKAMPAVERTSRGFAVMRGVDRYGKPYSIQDSSLADEACIWLGSDDEEGGRAHLTQADAAALIPLLQAFVAEGSIAASPPTSKAAPTTEVRELDFDRKQAVRTAAYALSEFSGDAPGTPTREALVILNAALFPQYPLNALTLARPATPAPPPASGEWEAVQYVLNRFHAYYLAIADRRASAKRDEWLAELGILERMMFGAATPTITGAGEREAGHGLGPHATIVEDEPDGFDAVAFLVGSSNAYLQQGDAQIFLGFKQAARILAALTAPPASVAADDTRYLPGERCNCGLPKGSDAEGEHHPFCLFKGAAPPVGGENVPAGMVLVPREPTEAMIHVGKAYHPMAAAIWSAMLTASGDAS